jgi:hypothetical protein
VGVGEEVRGVLLDLSDGEANTGVLSFNNNTSAEGSLKAAHSVATLLIADGVREGNARLQVSSYVSKGSHYDA